MSDEIRAQLGVVSQKEIKTIRQLSDSEYREYIKASKCMFDFLSDQQLYHFVRLNYYEYTNLLKRYLQEYTETPRTINMPIMYFNINRHISNFLSSVRMFLDHNEYKLKKRYGSDSLRVKRFKEACSYAYDNSFSYRFLYKLRDYVQHCGMPLGKLELEAKELSTTSRDIYRSLSVQFDRDVLLSKFAKWGSQLSKEIPKLPRYFEVTPHISEVMKCLEKIFLTLIEEEFPQLLEGAEFIRRLIAPAKHMGGVPSIIKIKKIGAGVKNLKVEIGHIPLWAVEMVINLKTHLSRSK